MQSMIRAKQFRNCYSKDDLKSEDMNCCPTEIATGDEMDTDVTSSRCQACKGHSRPVSRKTVLLMLKPHLLEQAMRGTYSFCFSLDCPVVYFEEDGSQRFTTEDLRIVVGVKATVDPIPLCYCFGFNESHIREEIAHQGRTTVPKRIAALIREGLCACDSRNPTGMCCLGEVNKVSERIQKESNTWSNQLHQ